MDIERMIVIGASAGGLEALKAVLGRLNRELRAPVVIVLHLAPTSTSLLPEVLGRATPLEVKTAVEGERPRHACVYVAPPDHHVLVRPESLHLSLGPRENRQRLAVDPRFRSAARWFGPGAVGVVLSGNLDDGAAGLAAIKQAGGACVLQDPADAAYPDMPQAAIANVAAAHVMPADQIGPFLERLASVPVASARMDRPSPALDEDRIASFDAEAAHEIQRAGRPSAFVCPDCGGTLFALESGGAERYRCRVGHACSIDSLHAEKKERLDEALWAALRALEEHADLSRRSAARARERGLSSVAERFDGDAHDGARRADVIRSVLSHERGGETGAR